MLTHQLETFTRYIDAIRKDDAVTVRGMLQKDPFLANAALKDKAYQGRWVTPLQHATICGSAKVFAVLLQFKADLNVILETGWQLSDTLGINAGFSFREHNYHIPFLLVFACQDGCTAHQNAQVASDAKAAQGKECGHLQIIRHLASNGIDLNRYEADTTYVSYPTFNLTYLAVIHGNAGMLRVLDEVGVDLRHKPKGSKSAQDFADYFAGNMKKTQYQACVAVLKRASAKKTKATDDKSSATAASTAAVDRENHLALLLAAAHRQLKLRWRHRMTQSSNPNIQLRADADALIIREVVSDQEAEEQRIKYPPFVPKLAAPKSVASDATASSLAAPNSAATATATTVATDPAVGDTKPADSLTVTGLLRFAHPTYVTGLSIDADDSSTAATTAVPYLTAAETSLPFQASLGVDSKEVVDSKKSSPQTSKILPLPNGNWVKINGENTLEDRVLTCDFNGKQLEFTYGWKFTTVIAVSDDVLVTGDEGGYVRVWNLTEARCVWAGLHSQKGVSKILAEDDVVISQDSCCIKTWDLQGNLLQEFNIANDEHRILDMTLQSKRRLAVLTPSNLCVYDIEPAASFHSHADRVPTRLSPLQVVSHADAKQPKKHLRWLLPQPESRILTISDGENGSIKVWEFDKEIQSYKCIATWDNHGLNIVQAVTLVDGSLIALVRKNRLLLYNSYSLQVINVVNKRADITDLDCRCANEYTVLTAFQNRVAISYNNYQYMEVVIQGRQIESPNKMQYNVSSVLVSNNQLFVISPKERWQNFDEEPAYVKIGSFFVKNSYRQEVEHADVGAIDILRDMVVYIQTLTCRIQPQPTQLHGLSNGLLLQIDPELGTLNFAELDQESEWIDSEWTDQVSVPELMGAKNCRYALIELPHGCLAIAAINGTSKNFVIVQIPPAIWNYDQTRLKALEGVISQASPQLISIVYDFLGKTKKQPVAAAANPAVATASATTSSVTTAVTAAPSHASVQRVSFWNVDAEGTVVVAPVSTTKSAGMPAVAEPPRSPAPPCVVC